MNKRHFLSLTALAPLARFLPSITLPAVDRFSYLQPFVPASVPCGREWLLDTFGMTGYVGASDARILVRIPVPGRLPDDGMKCDVASLDQLNSEYHSPFTIHGAPKVPQWVPCTECGRIGEAPEGEDWCPECHGDKLKPYWFGTFDGFPLSHAMVNMGQLAKILALPGPVRFALPVDGQNFANPPPDVMPFRFWWRYGDGFLMPHYSSTPDRLIFPLTTQPYEKRTSHPAS
jgi:RNA polymerase subunit RPABC4/transcription elongation factor Spt4